MRITPFDFQRDKAALLSSLYSADAEGLLANRAAIENQDAIALVARVGGETVAWTMAILHGRDDYGLPPDNVVVQYLEGKDAYLVSLEVRSDFQRKKVGSALLAAIEKEALAHGKHCLWLHTDGTNAGAQRFYERHGWIHQETTHRPGIVCMVYSKELHD